MYHFEQVRIVARKTLRSYWEDHAESKGPLQAWFAMTKVAMW